MKTKDSGDGRFGFLRHALAFANEIARDCVINRTEVSQCAKTYGLDDDQTQRVVALMRWANKKGVSLPKERLAIMAMSDPGLANEDIAQMFGMSYRWAEFVRQNAAAICKECPVPSEVEVTAGVCTSQETIRQRADEIKARALDEMKKRYCPAHKQPAIRQYALGRHAFIPVGA